MSNSRSPMAQRFRGFLPVVVDVETAGFNAETDALLEIAAIVLKMSPDGHISPGKTFHEHVLPFEGANLEPSALAFTGIDPTHPLRFAVHERIALKNIFNGVEAELKAQKCQRAVLVGHNPFFDLGFMKAAVARCKLKSTPFHQFTTFDTATLSALAVGQTVLARSCQAAGVPFDVAEAHSALYDTQRTAALFCRIVNGMPGLKRR